MTEQNLHRLSLEDREIIIIGTAHISQVSVDQVKRVIEEEKPDTVCIELCESRYNSLKDPDRWKKTDIVTIIKDGKSHLLLAQLLLASYQKKLGSELNIKPGQEMLTASEEAEKVGAKLEFIDRDVKTTLKRVWGSMSTWSVVKLFWSSIESIWKPISVTAEEIERMKSSDALAEAMAEFTQVLPEVRESLIDERDRYMSQKLRDSKGKKIVAVVGAGHVPGMEGYLYQEHDLSKLETTPPPSPYGKIFTYGIPLALLILLVYSVIQSGLGAGAKLLETWAIVTGSCAAVGAILALSHPLTILAAFISAPIATLHPLIATGWIAGLVEAWIRKPTVEDFENVIDDFSSIKGIFRNRVSRILVVIALTNLTASAGTIFGLTTLFAK